MKKKTSSNNYYHHEQQQVDLKLYTLLRKKLINYYSLCLHPLRLLIISFLEKKILLFKIFFELLLNTFNNKLII